MLSVTESWKTKFWKTKFRDMELNIEIGVKSNVNEKPKVGSGFRSVCSGRVGERERRERNPKNDSRVETDIRKRDEMVRTREI
jgi:hypothetical protein